MLEGDGNDAVFEMRSDGELGICLLNHRRGPLDVLNGIV
jgi:hypothetical protein